MASSYQILFKNRDHSLAANDMLGSFWILVGGGREPLSAERAANKIRRRLNCREVKIWVKRDSNVMQLVHPQAMCCPVMQGGDFYYSAAY